MGDILSLPGNARTENRKMSMQERTHCHLHPVARNTGPLILRLQIHFKLFGCLRLCHHHTKSCQTAWESPSDLQLVNHHIIRHGDRRPRQLGKVDNRTGTHQTTTAMRSSGAAILFSLSMTAVPLPWSPAADDPISVSFPLRFLINITALPLFALRWATNDWSLGPNETRQIFEIPSYVAGSQGGLTNALGDYCAKYNFMDAKYAKKIGLSID